MRNKNSTHEGGYTIIEIVIGLLIVGLSLTIYQVSLNTVQLNKQAKYQDLALRIANSKIEELRAEPYSALPASGTFSHALLTDLPSGQGAMTVDTYNDGMKEVTVTVYWQSGTATRNVSLKTLMAEIGGL